MKIKKLLILYFIASIIWITGTNYLLEKFVPSPLSHSLEHAKEIFYVLVTGWFFYFALKKLEELNAIKVDEHFRGNVKGGTPYRLLNSEGVIFISIDDNEMSQLKMLCDSIFGDTNCIGVIIQNKLNSKNDSVNIQKNHEYILVYRKQCNYINTKVKPTLINSAYIVKKILQEGEEYYYLNDPITTRGEGGILNARHNLGYTVYYNPTTKDKIAVCDYDIELAKTSNNEKELYTDNEDLISQGYVPIRPPKVRGKLGCWTWELTKFNKDKHLIVITENKRSKSYSVKKRTFVDESEVYSKDGKLYYNAYSKGNSKSIIEFSTNEGSTALSNVLGESGTFNNPKNPDMIKHFIRLFPKRAPNKQEEKEWSTALQMGEQGRDKIKGNNLDFYLTKLSEVREKTYEFLKKQDDQWLYAERQSPDGTPYNNYYLWFHVVEDEISHRGQIKSIKRLIHEES